MQDMQDQLTQQMGALPVNSDEVYQCVQVLDYEWSCNDHIFLLRSMQSCVDRLRASLTPGVLSCVFDEYFAVVNDSHLTACVIKWLEAASFHTTGRREMRENIIEWFKHRVPVPGVAKVEDKVQNDKVQYDTDKTLKHAAERASQLLKSTHILFDGVSNPNHYSVYKFDARELIMSSGTIPTSLVSFECVLASLRGPALQAVRQYICAHDLYQQSDRVSRLWKFLDSMYLTADASRHISELFHGCQQRPGESIASYIARFQRVSHLLQSQQVVDDVNLIIRLSSGLTSNSALMARGIVDSMGLSSFATYCIQLLNVAKSMEKIVGTLDGSDRRSSNKSNPSDSAPFAPSIDSSRVGNFSSSSSTSQLCLRCGSSGHVIDTCEVTVKFPCKGCGSTEHFTRICPTGGRQGSGNSRVDRNAKPRHPIRPNPSVPYKQPAKAMSNSISTDLGDVEPDTTPTSNIHNSVSIVHCNAMGVQDPRLIDSTDPLKEIDIQSKLSCIQQSCLIDTGAGANFVSYKLAEMLIKRRALEKHEIKTLTSPITITYGNSSQEQADCVLPLRVRVQGESSEWKEILAVVTRSSSYSMVLGRTGLKQLGLMSSDGPVPIPGGPAVPHQTCAIGPIVTPDSSAIESPPNQAVAPVQRPALVAVTGENRVQVHHALLEAALVLPYRAPRRSRSVTDLAIIHSKLEQMVSQGKVERCESRDAHMVHEVVLVDKFREKRLPRKVPTDAASLKRYRITLDLRCGNDLQPVLVGESRYALLPNEFAGKGKLMKSSFAHQHQSSSADILKHLPSGLCAFGKIDLDDAYSSVLIPPALRSLFCYSCPSPSGGEPLYYRWNCLVQGWRWSPLFFSVAVEFVLDQCRPNTPANVYLRHYQDDVLIAGSSMNDVKSAMNLVVNVFERFGFLVNASKTQLSDHTVFCGYRLSSDGIIPYPKSPVTSAFFTAAWSLFENAKSVNSRLTLLRQWSGRFNYYLGFLPPLQLKQLRSIYHCTSVLMRDPATFDGSSMSALRDALSSLCSFVADGLIATFPCGYMDHTLYSLICTDANLDSYSGILFRLCITQQDAADEHVPEIKALLEALKSQIPLNVDLRKLVLIPVRIMGGEFTTSEQKQSSTYRERVCQLRALDSFYNLLYGTVVMVSDNQNVGRTWHSIDETLSYGSNLVPWERFIATVEHTVWVPRNDSIVSLADFLARSIAPRKPEPIAATVSHLQHAIRDAPDGPADNNGPAPRLPQLVLPIREVLQNAYLDDSSSYLNVKMTAIYNYLAHGTRGGNNTEHLAARFLYVNGLLYHVRVSGEPQIYVPSGGTLELHDGISGSIRASILYHFHDSPIGLHRGYHKLAPEVSKSFWWPSLLGDCLQYCKSCRVCQTSKMRFSKFRGELSSITPLLPLSTWIIDFAGPMRLGQDEPSYILIAVCGFSSYCILIPTRDCTAATTAQVIFDRIVCQFGIPERIHSDRGSSFDAEIIRGMNSLLGISWKLSASYSPRTQGAAERLIQHMKSTFQILDFNWQQLPLIQMYHNTACIGSCHLSPHEIVFGLRANISPIVTSIDCNDQSDISQLIIETRITWQSFRAYMRDRQSDVYSLKSEVINFSPGDEVFRVYVTSRKTVRSGPFHILRKCGKNTYDVSGISYPIPEYQLHLAFDRPEHLTLESAEPVSTLPTPVDLSGVNPGDLIIFESYEYYQGETTAFFVGEWVRRFEHMVTIIRYWYNHDGQWLRWDNETLEIPVDSIKATGFRLTRDSKIPTRFVKLLKSVNQ